MASILRTIDAINKGITILLGILLGIMSIIIIFQVFSRFFLGLPLPWSEELARYIMAYTVFIGAAIALRYQRLIAVEAIAERLSPKKRRVLKIVIHIIAIIMFVLLFVKGVEMMGRVEAQLSAAMQISMAIPYASIPIGAVLLMMNAIAVIIENIIGKEGAH